MSGDWVLLRGLTRAVGHWGDFRDRLQAAAGGARVFAVDLPGAGAAHACTAPSNAGALLSHVRDQVRREGLQEPLTVVGLSLGGMVAVQWAFTDPASLRRVVLINTSMRPFAGTAERFRPPMWPRVFQVWWAADGRAAEREVLALTSSRPGDAAQVERRIAHWVSLRQAQPVSRGNALRQLLAAARFSAPRHPPAVPVLVLASAGDRLVAPVCSQRLASAWHCDYRLHPWAGHDLPLDDPDWILEQLHGSAKSAAR